MKSLNVSAESRRARREFWSVFVYLLLQAVQLLLGLVVLLAGRDSGILERFEVGVFSKCCHRHRTCHEGSRDGCYSGMAKESCRCSHLF